MLSIYQEYSNHIEEIFENSFDYIYLHDKKGKIIDVNNVIIRNLGYSKREILKMKVTDFLIEEVASDIHREIDETIRTGIANKPKTYKVRKKNGDFVFVEASAIPLRKNGEFYAILGIGHDVSAYKKVEQNLIISEQKFRHLFNQSPFSILLFDSEGNLIDSNGVFIQKMSEIAGIDFRGKNFLEIASYFQNSKQIIQLFSERIKSFRQGVDLEPIEFNITTMQGETIWLHWQSSKLEIDNQSYIQVIIQDITERKVAEQKLIESEAKFRVISEESMVGITILQDYVFKYVNQRALDIFGYNIDEVNFLESGDFLNNIHPEDRRIAAQLILKEQEGLKGSFIHNPLRGIKKNGEIIWIDMYAKSVIVNNKSAVLVVFIDFTDQVKAEKELKEAQTNFQVLFNNSTSGIAYHKIVYDQNENPIDYIITDINPKYEEILNLKKENVLNKKSTEVYQADRAPYLDSYSYVANSGKSTSFETYFPPLDKYFSISVISSKKGEFISVFDDISERKKAEISLKKQSENLSTINGIITLGNESTSLEEFIIKSYDRVLGVGGFNRGGVYLYDPETYHNKLIHHKNVHPDFIAAVEDVDISVGLFNKIFDKEEPFYIEDFSDYMENAKDLGVYSAVIIPLRSKDKYVGSMNLASPVHKEISQDELDLLIAIGKQMGLIIQKFESEKLLMESEKKFRTLFEEADEGIILAETGTEQIVSANTKMCEMLGYSLQELKAFHFADLHPKESLHYVDEKFEQELDEISMVNDIPMKRKDGSIFYCNVNSSQIELSGKSYFLGFFSDISNRLEAEQKLRESEEKFRTITEQSFMGIIVLQDGVFKYFNERAAEINGFSMEEISNWKPNEFTKIIHPDDKEFVITQALKKQEGETDVINHYQYRLIKKNGDIIWVENFSKSINYQGTPADLVMTIDITEKIKSEQKIKESEKILKDFIHNATDSISIWDSNLNLIEMNDIAVDPWNAKKRAEVGTNMLEMSPLIKETERYKEYLEVIKTGEPVSLDNVRIPPNTGERYFNIKSFKVGNGIGIIGSEITERIRFEQVLKESEEKFRNIAEQSFMGIVIVQDGKIKYMNKALGDMSQYSIEEMLNWSDKGILQMIHPDDVDYIVKRLRSNREGSMSQLSQNSFRIINKSGEIKWLEDYTSKIIYQGKVANLITVMDITDKKQAEQLIIEENKRLLELEELRKDLITRVSHELKTPMTSIFGTIQILLGIFREKLDKEALKYAKIGYRGCLRLKELIDNLLDASRLESKKFELRLQKEDLGILVDDCINDMSYLADTRKQTIEIDYPYKVEYEIDRLRFRQVITNIISNAIKNTPREGNIVISLNEKDVYIDIHVRDNGVGLTQKEKERLFEKFGKIERYGMDLDVDIEGCGLGLYISKEIVELHGGKILVESEGRNKGTTFTIRLFKR